MQYALGYIFGDEKYWHSVLSQYKTRGEWFNFDMIKGIIFQLKLQPVEKSIRDWKDSLKKIVWDEYYDRERFEYNEERKELLYQNPQIMGWNYDKGREIGVKIYKSTGVMYPPDEIISTLLHELAHSLTETRGHGKFWKEKDEYLQTFKEKYVDIFILKTSELY